MKANIMSRHVKGEVRDDIEKMEVQDQEQSRIKQAQDIEKRDWLSHPISKHILRQIEGLREANRDSLLTLEVEGLALVKAKERVYKTVIKMIKE